MKPQHGLQLIELVLVVAILGIVAVVAIPQLTASNPAKLDLAAQEVADALRFARAEAMRTALPHGALVNQDGSQTSYKDIAVYRVDTAASPFGIAALLYHPVDKQPYDRQVVAARLSMGIAFVTAPAPFTFSGIAGARQHLHFDAHGSPVYYQDGAPHRLLSGNVVLRQGQDQRTVTVQPITGRVTVQ